MIQLPIGGDYLKLHTAATIITSHYAFRSSRRYTASHTHIHSCSGWQSNATNHGLRLGVVGPRARGLAAEFCADGDLCPHVGRHALGVERVGNAGFGVAATHAAVAGDATDTGAGVGGGAAAVLPDAGAAAGFAAADADVDAVAAGLIAGLVVQIAEVGGRGVQPVDAGLYGDVAAGNDAAAEGGVAFYRELEAAVAGLKAALFGHVQVVAIDAGFTGANAATGATGPGGDAKAGVLLAAVVAAAVLQAVDAQLAANVASDALPAGDGTLQRGIATAAQRQLLASVDVGVAGKLTVKGLSLRLSAPGFVP